MFILIDNYDSFTYNLYHYFCELGVEVSVYRNDALSVDQLLALDPQGFIISPGPCSPDQAGVCLDLLANLPNSMPLLGVCLGHQSIGQHFGGKVIRAPHVVHGKTSTIYHKNTDIFKGLENPLTATRYHSLILDKPSIPDCLKITAETSDNIIMGLAHKIRPIYGVQFHPESIASQGGYKLFANFIERATGKYPISVPECPSLSLEAV